MQGVLNNDMTTEMQSETVKLASRVTLRAYQDRAKAALVAHQRGIVQAPAGSGKTIIAAAALDAWLRASGAVYPRVVWLANTREQCAQAEAALVSFPQIELSCTLEVACYAAGVSCRDVDLVILDECAHIAAPETRKCLEGCEGIRWGLSATPEREDELAPDVFELIGPVVCRIERAELVAAGQLARARVRLHAPNDAREDEARVAAIAEPLIQARLKWWNIPPEDVRQRTLWQVCLQESIIGNRKRNAAALALALAHQEDSVLMLVGTIKHGQAFQEHIPGSVMVHSKMGITARRTAMERFRAGDLRCMIATSLADEGLDLPCANVLIMVTAGRSKRARMRSTVARNAAAA